MPRAPKRPTAGDLGHILLDLHGLAVPIESVTLDPENANEHPVENLAAIRGSLTVYQQRKPIVVNRRTGIVEAGNGTLAQGRELGWKWIAAVFADDDEATAKGYAIADNRSAELSKWNREKLEAAIAGVNTGDANLEDMLRRLRQDTGIEAPAFEPTDGADQGRLDQTTQTTHTCPSCGHEFNA